MYRIDVTMPKVSIRKSLTGFPLVLKYLGEAWQREDRKGRQIQHPLGRRLQAGERVLSHLPELEQLLKDAEDVRGFQKLVKKLADARGTNQYLDSFTELYTCALFLQAACEDVDVGLEDGVRKRSDLQVRIDNQAVNVEVTRVHAPTERQARYEKRIELLVEEMAKIPSNLYITFRPHEEYDDEQVVMIAQIIRAKIEEYSSAGIQEPIEHFLSVIPPFTMETSLKGPHLARRPETIFRVGSSLVFLAGEGKEARRIREAVTEKYGKFLAGEPNVLVVLLASEPLEEAAQDLPNLFEGGWSKLGAVVLLSSWGRSRVVHNANAETPLTDEVMRALRRMAMVE